uniref:VQ domain-containing protein n=1 Tax=Opuntia streptacantha TaxID=393608 RepID=A0A7C8YGG7_OPUST
MASSSDLTSIETWAFRPAFENSWISEAFASDTDALTKALQKSISGPSFAPDGSPSAAAFSDVLNAIKPETTQHAQSVSSSGGSESETVSKRVARNPAPPSGKITKRKPRASKRSPTTYITADPANFREMVQQVTGIRFAAGQTPIGSVLKPEPQRPVGVLNRLQPGCLLPTLDTSAFLLDHHQQVAAPSAAAMGGQSSLGFGPPAVVAEGGGAGFDFDGLSCFPTLDSWKVM